MSSPTTRKFEFWLQRQWYGQGPPNPVLLALEPLFKAGVKLRQQAYRKGLKARRRLPVPVIVVGNLTVGGVGKTPLTIWLIEFLRASGYRPGVISRGYGGRGGSEPIMVTADGDPALVGDEALMIAQRTCAPVCVHRDRFAAGQTLLASQDCDVVVADDGLQHYALARDVEIVVVDGDRRFGNGHCLPAGPLRESADRLNTADLVVCRGEGLPGEYFLSIDGDEAVNVLDTRNRRPLGSFCCGDLTAVAGIGVPSRFFDMLTRKGLTFRALAFPDHHPFVADDIPRNAHAVIMTEKDAVKCRAFSSENDWYVPVSAHLPADFGDALLNLMKVNCDE